MLDAGGMFGIIPRVVWERSVPTDDKHRVELSHNCLLLEGGGRKVVIETGTGDKLDEKMSKIFGLDGVTIETALRDDGTDPADIDDVIVSHLHFDHAGGLTRRVREGETPDWSENGQAVMRTFPKASVHAQRREWNDALANRSVMTRTYFRDHLAPIADQLALAEAPPPFEPGSVVDRDATPMVPLAEREVEVLPGIFVFNVPGHTWGQQAVRFTDDEGRTVVFSSDLIPTRWHAGAAYSLAYDVEPYTSMVSKRWFLEEAAERDWLLVLDHEPRDPLVRARPDGKGWYELIDA